MGLAHHLVRAACVLWLAAAAAASWPGVFGYTAGFPAYGLGLSYAFRPARLPSVAASPVLTVLAEAPAAVDDTLVAVPLLAVPKDRIRVIQDSGSALTKQAGGSSLSRGPGGGGGAGPQLLPAVRVVLRRPLMVPAASACSVPFPAAFTVRHAGRRVPLRVGSLIAPVPAVAPSASVLQYPVYVLYAVPVQPLALRPFAPSLAPSRRPVLPPLTVTVLDFPEAVATPSSLFYQPPLEDGLGNREPPQPVAPAGVVQSTAPQPNLSVFVNSKESPFLQVLRDEAALNNEDQGRGEIVIDEDNDSIVVIAPN